jgi:DNA repair photolyase
MYPLRPAVIFAHKDLRDNDDAMSRLKRILGALGRAEDTIDWYGPEDAYRVTAALAAWTPDKSRADWKFEQPLVLTRMLSEGDAADDPVVKNRPADVPDTKLAAVLGYINRATFAHTQQKDIDANCVCWPTLHIGSVSGCSHACVYCGEGRGGRALVLGLNVREYLDTVVRGVIAANPWQKCFLMIGWGADMATLEPEYGLYRDFLALLAEHDDLYGYFHTNGDEVDWVRDLPHRDRLIGIWSMSCNEVSRLLEPCAPSATSRIEAAGKLCDWGVPVRIKLKPVLPIRGWREYYAAMIAELFARFRPETIGFTTMIWTPYEKLVKILDTNLLDPEFVEAARLADAEMKHTKAAPFPHDKRAEVYRFLIREVRRHDRKIPLFLSTETPEMWDELTAELGQNPRHFLCGCNPVQGPGPHYVPSPLNESNYRTDKEGIEPDKPWAND